MPSLKQIGTICFYIILSVPSLANIDAENESPTCDESVLNASNGTANLEINWEPNVIPLRWYSGNTEIHPENTNANSCTYDGALNIPATPPEREGYNFAGWRVRPTMEFSESTLGLSGSPQVWSKDNLCSYNNNATGYHREVFVCSKDSHFFDLQQKEYKMLYPSGKMLYGISKCSARVGVVHSSFPEAYKEDWFEADTTNIDNATGEKKYCWCKITGFRETEQGPMYAPSNTLGWFYNSMSYSNEASCNNGLCAFGCAYYGPIRIRLVSVD